MSNASLKEQLQSLGLSISGSEKSPNLKKKYPQQKTGAKNSNRDKRERNIKSNKNINSQPKPAWLEQAQYGVELLKAHFPLCFKDVKDIQPLKIGIKQDLVKHLSTREEIVTSDKACMVNSLSYYVNSPAYHKRVIAGAPRIDLEGNSVGNVSAEEAKYSVDCRAAKLQKKQDQLDKKKNSSSKTSEATQAENSNVTNNASSTTSDTPAPVSNPEMAK